MKILCTLCSLLIFQCYSQNHELDFGIQAGVPIDNLRIKQPDSFTRYDIYGMESMSDVGFSLFYKYRIWKTHNLYITSGVSLSRAQHSIPFYVRSARELIVQFPITNYRITVKYFGIEKKFLFYDNKFNINLGLSVTHQYYLNDYQNYSAFGLKVEDDAVSNAELITYKYYIDLHYNKYKGGGIEKKSFNLNGEYYLQFQGFIKENISLNLTLDYYRNIVFYYARASKTTYDANNAGDFVVTPTFDHYDINRTHYLGLKLGCSFKF